MLFLPPSGSGSGVVLLGPYPSSDCTSRAASGSIASSDCTSRALFFFHWRFSFFHWRFSFFHWRFSFFHWRFVFMLFLPPSGSGSGVVLLGPYPSSDCTSRAA